MIVLWGIKGVIIQISLSNMENKSTQIIVVVLALIIGLGAGYYYGTSTASPPMIMPEPVDGLDRPDSFPLVHGWYKGTDVTYFDFGGSPKVAIPILVFFQENDQDTPISGQMNIIDSIPGMPGYSDFWRVFKVLAPSDYEANSITSFEGVMEAGYDIEPTDIVVNCPVVNPDAMTEEISYDLVQGWFKGREVFYFDFAANTGAEGFVLDVAPIYAFFGSDGDPVEGQMNVIDVVPGDTGYSDLWQVFAVTVGMDYAANSLTSADAIMEAAEEGTVTIGTTNIYVNCPIVE